jgi:phytoene synthase
MQLTNICRDVAEDWDRGRVYLPDELVPGVADHLGEPLAAQPPAPIAAAIATLLALADRYYRSGDRGIAALPWRAGVAVRAARRIYAAIGDELRARACDPLAGRAVVSRWKKRRLVGRAIARQLVSLPGHAARRVVGRIPRPPRGIVEARDVVSL